MVNERIENDNPSPKAKPSVSYYAPASDIAKENQEKVDKIFAAPAKEILYKGVDNYLTKERGVDLKEYYALYGDAKNNEIIHNKDQPYFFRQKLDEFLKNHTFSPGEDKVTTLDKLLGEKGKKLFEWARDEERFDKNYINRVVTSSLTEHIGPKWDKRPVEVLLGPSSSGKSFIKKELIEAIADGLPKASLENTTNNIIFSDGGIERDESSVRKLMIATGVSNYYKDILDLDKGGSSKLKKNIAEAAELTKDLGIVIVDTASTYTYGDAFELAGTLVPTLKRLMEDENNAVGGICIVADDDAIFAETVTFMGHNRSQASTKYYEQMNPINSAKEKTKLSFDLMNLPQLLPEYKKYQEKNRQDGVDGSKHVTGELAKYNKDTIYSIHDLALQTIANDGKLEKGGQGIAGTMPISKRIIREWSKKTTDAARLEAGINAYLKPAVEREPGDESLKRNYAVIPNGSGWIADLSPTLPNENRRYVVKEEFDKYTKATDAEKHALGFGAYNRLYSRALLHTTEELALYRIKQGVEKEIASESAKPTHSPNDAHFIHLNKIIEQLNKLQIGGGSVENYKKLDRVKDYPVLIDEISKELITLEGKISSKLYDSLFIALDKIRDEVKVLQQVAKIVAIGEKRAGHNEERSFYDAKNFFGIETSVLTRDDANKVSTEKKDGNATELSQDKAQTVVYKGEILEDDQVIVAKAEFEPGKVLHLEQDKTGTVVDKSSADLDVEGKQLAALKQAQMLLNNYDTSKGNIVINGSDPEQAARLYAAILHFVKNDPEIKSRMKSPRWILPSYSPEKLIQCNVLGFTPPKTISDSFIDQHLPMLKTLGNNELKVLNVEQRAALEKTVMQASAPIDVVKEKTGGFKAMFKEAIQKEKNGVEVDTDVKMQPPNPSRSGA